MKKIKTLALSTLLITQLYGAATLTHTTLDNAQTLMGKDVHGATIYERQVTIETNNFKVDNFWNKFSNNGTGNAQTSYNAISKSGTVQIGVEATSLCTLYKELDVNGCSGQKPFLINDEAVNGVYVGDTITLLFQKDYNGTSITYNDINASVFYPLDVQRDEKFYKEEGTKSFKTFFQKLFDSFFVFDFFSKFFSHEVVDKNNIPSKDIRQRYIANIVSGIDQNHLLEKAVTPLTTNALNTPVSLIDYSENVSSTGSCSLFFFKFPESSPFCNLMGSMPFISMFSSTKPATNYTIDTIQSDTENALVSFAGTYADLNVNTYQNGTVYQKQSTSTGLISGMINMMKCFFFGCPKVNDVQEAMDSYYGFSDADAINMTFAITNNGSAIDDFETFRLMGIHSLSGNEHMCQVKKKQVFFTPGWTKTFLATDSDTAPKCIRKNFLNQCIEYSTTETVEVTTDGLTASEWLTWCDYMVEKYKNNVTTVCTGFFFFQTCTKVPASVKEDGYEVLSYTNESKRGLLLDLKLVEPLPTDEAVTLRYKLLNVQN